MGSRKTSIVPEAIYLGSIHCVATSMEIDEIRIRVQDLQTIYSVGDMPPAPRTICIDWINIRSVDLFRDKAGGSGNPGSYLYFRMRQGAWDEIWDSFGILGHECDPDNDYLAVVTTTFNNPIRICREICDSMRSDDFPTGIPFNIIDEDENNFRQTILESMPTPFDLLDMSQMEIEQRQEANVQAGASNEPAAVRNEEGSDVTTNAGQGDVDRNPGTADPNHVQMNEPVAEPNLGLSKTMAQSAASVDNHDAMETETNPPPEPNPITATPSKRFKTEPSFAQPSTSRAQQETSHYDPMSTSPGRRFSWAHNMNSISNTNSETSAINSATTVPATNGTNAVSVISSTNTVPVVNGHNNATASVTNPESSSSAVGHNSASSDDDMVIDGSNLVLMFKVAYKYEVNPLMMRVLEVASTLDPNDSWPSLLIRKREDFISSRSERRNSQNSINGHVNGSSVNVHPMEVPQIKVESVQEIADPINVPDIKVESVQQLPDSGT